MAEPVVRGYIASRPVRGSHYPQRVQNLVVRDYAARRGLAYRLSATEYAMPGCTMMLNNVLAELDRLDGVVFFSMFMLPERDDERFAVYERFIGSGKRLHAALEDLVLERREDIGRWETILGVDRVLAHTPFHGRYEKNDAPLGNDSAPFLAALGLR